MHLVCLVGEQPIPNLLPTLHFRPARISLVETQTTKKVGENLKNVILKELGASVFSVPAADAYNIEEMIRAIEKALDGNDIPLMFNLTGGTKTMKKNADVCYLQSEGGKSLLHRYKFSANGDLQRVEPEEVPELLTIKMHLEAHGLGTKSQNIKNRESEGRKFEERVGNALKDLGAEIAMNVGTESKVEADILFRFGNQFGVAELKTGKSGGKKAALEQLSLLVHRESLGIYAKRYLIINAPSVGRHMENIAKARGVEIICLDGEPNDDSESLRPQSVRKLQQALRRIFGERNHVRDSH
jgi:hypothetical protein